MRTNMPKIVYRVLLSALFCLTVAFPFLGQAKKKKATSKPTKDKVKIIGILSSKGVAEGNSISALLGQKIPKKAKSKKPKKDKKASKKAKTKTTKKTKPKKNKKVKTALQKLLACPHKRKDACSYWKKCLGGVEDYCMELSDVYFEDSNALNEYKKRMRKAIVGCRARKAGHCLFMAEIARQGVGQPKSIVHTLIGYYRAYRIDKKHEHLFQKAFLKHASGKKGKERVNFFTQVCRLPFAPACYQLALTYEGGYHSVKQDSIKARKFFARACKAKYGPACFLLGAFYKEGLEVPKDPKTARSYFASACSMKVGKSCVELGHLFRRGEGVVQNCDSAQTLYQMACKRLKVKSACSLRCDTPFEKQTKSLKTGKGKERWQDVIQIFLLELSRLDGICQKDAKACVRLGGLLMYGWGGRVDYVRARELFEKACKQKNGLGCARRAILSQEGLGLKKDTKVAISYFRKACKAKELGACRLLGEWYGKGVGVKKDLKKAESILSIGCKSKDSRSCIALGSLHPKATVKQKVSYFEKACILGNNRGCYLVAEVLKKQKNVDAKKVLTFAKKGCQLKDGQSCYLLYLDQKKKDGKKKSRAAMELLKTSCGYGFTKACYILATLQKKKVNLLKNIATQLPFFKKACELNQPLSCKTLGKAYFYGMRGKWDFAKSRKYFQKACQLKHGESCVFLGTFLQYGVGGKIDFKASMKTLEKAVKLKGYLGYLFMGQLHEFGRGFEKSLVTAAKFYEKGCQNGVELACYRIAKIYEDGIKKKIKKDLKKSEKLATKGFKIAKKKCAKKDPRACSAMARGYHYGTGTDKDPIKAVHYYKLACDKKNGYACSQLAYIYRYGLPGIRKDSNKAQKLFLLGCVYKNGRGCRRAAESYRWGRRKRVVARRLYLDSCSLGDMSACNTSAYYSRYGYYGFTRNAKKARELYRRACFLGNGWSCYYVGKSYENGWGGSVDKSVARNMYKLACDAGNISSCQYVADYYKNGVGGDRDLSLALEMYKKLCTKWKRAHSCKIVGDFYRLSKGAPQNCKESMKFYKIACKRYNRAACNITCKKKKPDPKRKHTLHVALTGTVFSLDPIHLHSPAETQASAQVFETLFEYDTSGAQMTLKPLLLAGMPSVSKDQKTYTFTLKKGILFQDHPSFSGGKGRELVAKDVLYSIRRMAQQSAKPSGWWLLEKRIAGLDAYRKQQYTRWTSSKKPMDFSAPVKGLTSKGRYSFSVTLTKPFPQFLHILANPVMGIVAKESVDYYHPSKKRGKFGHHPVGTGPYKLSKWKKATSIRFARNTKYRKTNYAFQFTAKERKAGLHKKSFRALKMSKDVLAHITPTQSAAMRLFRDGSLDYVLLTPEERVSFVGRDGKIRKNVTKVGLQMYSTTLFDLIYTGFSFTDKVVGGKSKRALYLRKALVAAVDLAAFNKKFYYGLNAVYRGVIPPGLTGFATGVKTKIDLNLARKYLKKAGYPGGKGLKKLIISTNYSSTSYERSKLWKKQLAKIGIKVDFAFSSFSQLSQKISQGKVQMFSLAWTSDYADAENNLSLFWKGNISTGLNSWRYNNPTFNKLFEKASVMQPSPARAKLYRKLNQFLIDDAVLVGSMGRNQSYLLRGRIKNFQAPAGSPVYWKKLFFGKSFVWYQM